MKTSPLYNILVVVAGIVAVLFVAMVFLFSKGDAMQSGGSVRTTFKGRATFDDQISKITLYLAGSFIALCLILDFLAPKG